ncbi:endonuclease/exonuclease/phosphatase family protein [Urechidicola vernalis]|uniref:Endonuclease/exonuclease/phosphatase family protein n=1 Tax=Urechidicola vernalis TaxID=3075600 RepID=A0ABU2Y4F2_9FLAO|nr:endonuclease/exonuclease/phosphatase family protein [Urechidicola sp. P050]MDT0553071.1 endonuclease/exonuclease/phosphatase family protein [Urechidicola sp. P050]
MRQIFILIFFSSLFIGFVNPEPPKTFKVMAWNIFHGGNDIENGQENVIEIIREINPDIILMVETYGSGKKIAESLGYNFHLIAKEGTVLDDKRINLSIYSKFPFGERIDTENSFYLGGREIYVHGAKMNFFSNWFHYEPWSDAPENLEKSVNELLAWEQTGAKYRMINKMLPVIKKYAAQSDSIPMVFGGDMNTPSHLDWGEETKEQHNGLVVPWYGTKVLEDIGLVDSYREMYPNPITHPGITWDWPEKVDEHRIDYIFYKSPSITPIESTTYKSFFNERLTINNKTIINPSDHGIVVTTFQLND